MIALSTRETHVNMFFDIFNSYHSKMKFTVELESESLNFLDVIIIKSKNTLIHDWYHKVTFSGRYLNYFSCYSICQKMGTVIGLIDRTFLLSHPQFHQKNLDLIINILSENGYPLDMIFLTIKKRLYINFERLNNIMNHQEDDIQADNEEKKSFFHFFPFVPIISEKIKYFFRNNLAIKIAYTGLHKLNKFIKVQKDELPTFSKSNVVY